MLRLVHATVRRRPGRPPRRRGMGKRPPGRPPKGLGMVRRRPERSPRSSVKRSPGSSMVGPWKVAHQEWRKANVGTTRALLEGTRADLRGWEWRYVLVFLAAAAG